MVSPEVLGTNGISSVGGELVKSLSSLGDNSATSLENAFRASSAVGNADYNFLSSSWESEGKFGDFDGRNDAPLTIKDAEGKIAETFALTGNGYGEVFKNTELNFEYVFFAGTDAITSVAISAINNIRFGDYLGSTLNVQTQGSITAGNITLQNTKISSSPGLSLRSGLSDVQNSTSSSGYRITDLGTLPGGSYSEANGINNSGEVVGNSDDSAFLYSNGRMTDLGILPGGRYSYASSINDSGTIVGYSDSSDGQDYLERAFVYSNGQMTDLGTLPGGISSEAYGINNKSQIVGTSDGTFDGNTWWTHAFLYSNGQMTDLATLPGGKYAVALSINNAGQVVGYSDNSNSNSWEHAFLYSNGQMTDLGTLYGGSYSRAYDINDSGQVVGHSDSSGSSYPHAFLYSNGQMTDLGTLPGGGQSYASGINNSGTVVGYSDGTFDGNTWWTHAFLYSNAKMTDLNSLIPSESGWTLDIAGAINDKGQIVGSGVIAEQRHAFLLDPISSLTPTPRDGITVGNISTLGSSILLQGLKVKFTGSDVITKGGKITIDGPTVLNSSTGTLAFNSTKSTANSKGGDIIFKNSVDGETAGTQSLSLTAGTGNITFNKAIGSNATLIDLKVNSAKTVTAKGEITSDGNITITATQNITTLQLTSNSGAVKLTSNQGAVATQDITSGSDTAILADQSITTLHILSNSGAVKLTSKLSALSTGDITTGGNNNSGNQANITLQAADGISAGNLSTNGIGKVSVSSGKVNDKIYNSSGNVTFGSISAKEVDILSNGGVTTQSDIETNNGDIDITALRDILTQKITTTNGAARLISGLGAITATGEINSDNGLAALARQNITTNKIQSSKYAVILNSNQGAVTVNGAVASSSDVSLAALKDVVAQDITSLDGAVALISHIGTVTANGALASNDNVEVGAALDIVVQNIRATYGTAALVSTQGAVTANEGIYGGIDVAISAKQNINTGRITALEGKVTLTTEQGKVTTTGGVWTDGGDIYVSAAGDVLTQNMISNGGAITIDSSQGSVATGYLRSDDGNESGGKIYIQVATTGSIRVNNSVDINGTEYSIYTSVDKKDWISFIYGSEQLKSNKSQKDYVIAANVLGPISFKPPKLPLPKLPIPGWLIPVIEIFDAVPTAPSHVDEVNPITGGRYLNKQDYELVRQLTPNQEAEIRRLIKIPSIGLNYDYVQRRGRFATEVDQQNRRCYGIPLTEHLGENFNNHHEYADWVTGSKGDFAVIPPTAVTKYRSAIYDGIVLQGSAATKAKPLPSEPVGALGEVKTGHEFLVRIANGNPLPERPNPNGGMYPSDQARLNQLSEQVRKEALVARACHKNYFLSFNRRDVAQVAGSLLNPLLARDGISVRVRYITPPPVPKSK